MKNKKNSFKKIIVSTSISLAVLGFAVPVVENTTEAATGNKTVAQVRHVLNKQLDDLEKKFTEQGAQNIKQGILELPEDQRKVYYEFLDDVVRNYGNKSLKPQAPKKPQKQIKREADQLATYRYDLNKQLDQLEKSYTEAAETKYLQSILNLPEDQRKVYYEFLEDVRDKYAPKIPVVK